MHGRKLDPHQKNSSDYKLARYEYKDKKRRGKIWDITDKCGGTQTIV